MPDHDFRNYSPDALRRVIAGEFVVADGIDCGGKGTAIAALGSWVKERGLKIFNLVEEFQKKTNSAFPEDILAVDFDVLIMAEPPYGGGGLDLRRGVLQNLGIYSAKETAEGFSAYRSPLFGQVVEPVLRSGRSIFCERGVSTSLEYQVVQSMMAWNEECCVSSRVVDPEVPIKDDNILSKDYILSLPGNQRALRTPPTMLMLMLCEPEEAARRVGSRFDKDDNCAFEKKKRFLIEIDKAFRSGWLERYFSNKGSEVASIDTTSIGLEGTKASTVGIWQNHLKRKLARQDYCSLVGSCVQNADSGHCNR